MTHSRRLWSATASPSNSSLRSRETASHTTSRREGSWAIGRLEQFHEDGVRLDDGDAARLLVAADSVPIRDTLWNDIGLDNSASHVAPWTDLTSRAPDEVRAAPAAPLGFAVAERQRRPGLACSRPSPNGQALWPRRSDRHCRPDRHSPPRLGSGQGRPNSAGRRRTHRASPDSWTRYNSTCNGDVISRHGYLVPPPAARKSLGACIRASCRVTVLSLSQSPSSTFDPTPAWRSAKLEVTYAHRLREAHGRGSEPEPSG